MVAGLLVPGKGDQYARTRTLQRVFTPRTLQPVKGDLESSGVARTFVRVRAVLLVLSAVRSSAMQRCWCACCVALGPLLYRFF